MMTIFTRGVLLISLLSCFSCARRQQALYQFTPPHHFAKALPSMTTDRETTILDPAEIESTGEVLVASSAVNFEQYREQIELNKNKKGQLTTRESATKTLTATSEVYKKKKSSYKLPLLKQRLKDVGPQTSGLAIASLVFGILAFFILGVVFGPLAVIFGGVALSKIKNNPEVKGRGLAVAGLVLGIVATVLIIVILAAR